MAKRMSHRRQNRYKQEEIQNKCYNQEHVDVISSDLPDETTITSYGETSTEAVEEAIPAVASAVMNYEERSSSNSETWLRTKTADRLKTKTGARIWS